MTKRAADDDDSSSSFLSPPPKARRLVSGHSPPGHRLSLANCWEAADTVGDALAADRMLTAAFSDWDLSFNGSLSDHELAKLLGMTPTGTAEHVQRLDVSYTLVSDAFLMAICRWAPNLQALRLEGCANLTDAALCGIVQRCPQLEELSLAKCPHVSDLGVATAARHLPVLKALDLHGCARVTGAAMKLLVQRCPLIQTLRLGATALDAPTLSAMLSYFLLVELDVSELPIGDAQLVRLVEKQPLLQRLDVSLCHELTRQGLEHVLSSLPLKALKAFGLHEAFEGIDDVRVLC